MSAITAEMRALILAELAKRVAAEDTMVRALIGVAFDDGARHTYRSPLDGQKLGMIWRTDPEPKWKVTDPRALKEWLADPANGYVVDIVDLADGVAFEQVLAVVQDHAPELLTVRSVVRDGAVDDVLAAAAEQGETDAPGVERIKPPGVLHVKADKAAGQAIEALVKAGMITWDGKAIEAGGDEAGAEDEAGVPVAHVPVLRLPIRHDEPRPGGDAA